MGTPFPAEYHDGGSYQMESPLLHLSGALQLSSPYMTSNADLNAVRPVNVADLSVSAFSSVNGADPPVAPLELCGLSKLPTEIKSQILTYVVWHDGDICPLSEKAHEQNHVILAGDKWLVKAGAPATAPSPKQRSDGTWEAPTDAEIMYAFNAWRPADATETTHFCTMSCLLQPPIARVDRYYREMALDLFYSINSFRFEFGQGTSDVRRKLSERNHVLDAELVRRIRAGQIGFMSFYAAGFTKRSPAHWWRAIGDTNLRSIRKMTLVCHPKNSYRWDEYCVVEITEYGRHVRFTNNTLRPVYCTHYRRAVDDSSFPVNRFFTMNAIRKRLRYVDECNIEAAVQPYLAQLHSSGTHVRALECVLAVLEPVDQYYLPDDTTLDGPSWADYQWEKALREAIWSNEELDVKMMWPPDVYLKKRPARVRTPFENWLAND